jgi:alpha-galactosidase
VGTPDTAATPDIESLRPADIDTRDADLPAAGDASISTLTLTADGVSLVLDATGEGLPGVVYWGPALGPAGVAELDDSIGAAVLRAATTATAPELGAVVNAPPPLPVQGDNWPGRPGLAGDRAGRWPYPRLRVTAPITTTRDARGGTRVTIDAADEPAGIAVRTELELSSEGVVRLRHRLTNDGPGVFTVAALRGVLPVPDQATELLDLTGRWALERVPQRTAFGYGTHAREGRHGRPDHDAVTLLIAGTPGFGFGHGQVWGVHVAWSGDTESYAERFPTTTGVLGGGELAASGELRLEVGETYTSPWLYFVHSDAGLDGLSDRLHRMLRARPTHPSRPRPVVLNTWEAVYFDHDLERLCALADRGARVGVERFVLDDGWFRGRRDDTAGLGDWYVDERVWPHGLRPLIDHVRGLGMEFGLWVEPEMVNPDSNLARAHPDWLLAAPGRAPLPRRNQHVLDLARPEVSAYLLERLDALLSEYDIAYLKWDHNRWLREPVHDGAAGVHHQTRAVYELIDRVRALHPRVEIESCSGGGGRVDLGIIERTERVWASDTNDPIDRQGIQRWTGLLLPPELVGCHVGATAAHTTGRVTRLRLRAATALFGHAGIEWDLLACSDAEIAELTGWVNAYKRLRGLLHSGMTVRVEHPDPAALLHGVVARDGGQAVFCYVQLASSVSATPVALRLSGLDDDTDYVVRCCDGLDAPERVVGPLRDTGVTLPGRVLRTAGITVPRLDPADALVLEISAR